MKILKKLPIEKLMPELKRPYFDPQKLQSLMQEVFSEVENKGDAALSHFTQKFDGQNTQSFQLAEDEKAALLLQCDKTLQKAIQAAYRNIKAFHQAQKPSPIQVKVAEGLDCWQQPQPIEKVGLYIPGGSAPLFSSVLMLGVPAQLAGCPLTVLCSPPNEKGSIHPAILFAASLCGIKSVFCLGGAQAIAAMTLGTESIPKVDKIFGAGNQYVTAAKQYAQYTRPVAIDLPAGPSELLIIADQTANPEWVAADLLAQAEHGADSQVILLTTAEALVEKVSAALTLQLAALPRKAIAEKALANSAIILVDNLAQAFEVSNRYAPEHLSLALENPMEHTAKVKSAGAVFLGSWSCESLGDYASGTNHTLPTGCYAAAYSGVGLDSFYKKISFQNCKQTAFNDLAETVSIMAAAEGLAGHQRAVLIRQEKLKNPKP